MTNNKLVKIFKKNGLEVPTHWCVWVDEEEQFEDCDRRRIVVKPSKEGSSYGVTILNRPGETWFDEDEDSSANLTINLE